MRPWLVYLILTRDDSTIRWAMQTLFSKENPKAEEATTITSIEVVTLQIKSSFHPRNSSTSCSLASNQGAGGRSSSKDSKGSSAGRVLKHKGKMTSVPSSDKCCRCFCSSSSLYSQVCSQVASFRMVRTTITACSALITTSSS